MATPPDVPPPPAPRRPVVLVTGAGRRIGRAIALRLAAAGHDVAVHCRASRQEADATAAQARALGARAEVVVADLADEAACRSLLRQVLGRFGQADAVVNNASLFEYDDARHASPALMERHWRANTAAPVLLAQALAAHLDDRAAAGEVGVQGCVVNLLDQKLVNPNPDYFSYTLSKAALREATVLLAQALAPRVRVVGVAPGLTLGSELIDAGRLAQLQQATPLGRGVQPEDVADAVAYLLGARAVTGAVLVVDAGSHLRPAPRDFAFLQNA